MTLLTPFLRQDGSDPDWQDRDRLLLAKDLPDRSLALPVAAGLAHAERLMAQLHGRSLVDHRVWLIADAADLAGGAAQEAAAASVLLRLERLAVIVSCGDAARLCDKDGKDGMLLAGFSAHGWAVRRVSQEDELAAALSAAQRARRPTLIACPDGLALRQDQAPPEAGRGSGATARRVWLKRLARHGGRGEFERMVAGRLPARWHDLLGEPSPGSDAATAATVHAALARAAAPLGELSVLSPQGVWQGRIQAMGGALDGLALHGGLLPVGIASLADADLLLAPLRMAADLGLRVLLVLTEPPQRSCMGRRAALRAMPNLFLLRPADASEAIECLELALRRTGGPSVLLLSEAQVPLLSDRPSRTRAARGGTLVRDAGIARDVTLLASGPEVAEALSAADDLAGSGLHVAVASLPCWTLFAQQDATWREAVLGQAPVVAIERGPGFGWQRWTGRDGLFLDPDTLGISPAQAIRRFLDRPGKPRPLLENSGGPGYIPRTET